MAGQDEKRSILALTGVRFIAAFMVFVSHYPVPGLTGWFYRVTRAGYAGVTFFFVLSGFVLTYNYFDAFRGEKGESIPSYFVSRFARVYPLYILMTVFVWLNTGASEPLWQSVFAIQAWHPDFHIGFGLNGPAWSISVEVFLYAIFPALIVAMHWGGVFRSKAAIASTGALVVAAMIILAWYFVVTGRSILSPLDPASAHRWLYRMPLTRVFDFMLGILAAGFYLKFASPSAASQRLWTIVAYAAIAVIIGIMGSDLAFFSAASWDVAYAIPSVLLILALAIAKNSAPSAFLSSSTFVLLGESSYAFYLVHWPAGILMHHTDLGDSTRQFTLYALFTVQIMALGIGMHVMVEKPARDWIKAIWSRRWRLWAAN